MADFLGMMKQAAQLQSKMQAMQEELGHVEVEGISGGGLVSVRMTAKMEVKTVKIDPSLVKADEIEILEDLLVTAHNDARRKAEAAMQEKIGDYLKFGVKYVWVIDPQTHSAHVFQTSGDYRVQFRLKQKNKVILSGTTEVKVRPGIRDNSDMR